MDLIEGKLYKVTVEIEKVPGITKGKTWNNLDFQGTRVFRVGSTIKTFLKFGEMDFEISNLSQTNRIYIVEDLSLEEDDEDDFNWCKCGDIGQSYIYSGDNGDEDCVKHHYHCSVCGKIIQIG